MIWRKARNCRLLSAWNLMRESGTPFLSSSSHCNHATSVSYRYVIKRSTIDHTVQITVLQHARLAQCPVEAESIPVSENEADHTILRYLNPCKPPV
ncbi:hypothetical protein BaRGS_00030966 [Batillaria attramentaria]|uniref:Uncharacterized protein n=1 Tax=Batillaria attramentaria TaxID=370345 RepID=A0ABD0JSF8_9CAEN